MFAEFFGSAVASRLKEKPLTKSPLVSEFWLRLPAADLSLIIQTSKSN